MSLLLIVSIVIRLAAIGFGLVWSLVLLRRLRDWRIALFTVALGLMAAREGLTLLGRSDYGVLSLLSGAGHTPGILVSVVAAVAVFFLLQIVTERRRSDDVLRESERRFRVLFENSAEAITLLDASGSILYMSPNNERLWGFGTDEVVARSSFEFVHPDDSKLVEDLLARLAQHPEECLTSEFRLRAKDGTWRHTEATGRNLLADPSVQAIVVNFRDITERRLAADALRESEDRYRDLIEHSQDLICTHDLDGRLLSINPWAAKVLGYEPDIALKMNIRDGLAPEVRHEFDEYIAKIRKEGAAQGIMVTQTRFGEKRLWEYSNTLRTEGVPAPVVRGMAHDITERKRAEEALRESEAKFRALAETAGAAIYIYRGLDLVYVNPTTEAHTGYTRDELLKKSFMEVVHPESRELVKERALARQRGEPVPDRYEFKILTKTGETRWIDAAASSVEYEGKPAAIGTSFDITDRKRAEEALHKSQARLQHVLLCSPAIVYSLRLEADTFVPEWISESVTRLTGYTTSEALGDSWWDDHLHPDDRERVLAEMPRLLADDRLVREYRFQHKDGGYHWLHDELRLLRDESGDAVEAIGSWVDVTERREAEAALRDSEERFRSVVSSMNDVVFTLDPQHRCSGLFGHWPESFNLKREDVIGKTATDFLGGEPASIHEEANARALQGEQVVYEWSAAGGRGTLHFQSSLSPIRNQNGEITGAVGVGRDITERKQAEERIHFQASLLDRVRNAVIAVDLDYKVVFWNSFAETLYQWKKEEALGQNVTGLIVPDAGRTVGEAIVSSLKQTGHWEGEFVTCRKDGSTFPAYVHNATIKGANGEIIGYVGVSTDLTERKRLDRALWESEATFQSFMRHLPGSTWIKDIDGRYVFLNLQLQETLSNHQEDWRGRTDIELFPPQIAARFLRNDRIVLTSRRELQVVETWTWKGEVRHALVTKFPIFDEQGELVLVAGNSVDITDLRNAEDEVRSQKEILQTIFDHIPVMIRFRDEDGRIKLVNREWERTFGWSLDEIESRGLDLFAELYPDPEYRQYVLNFIAASTGEFTDLKVRARDGRVIDATFANVRVENGTNIGIGQDITQRKRAEEALRDSEERFRSYFELGLIGIAITSPSKGWLEVNDRICEILGYERSELLQKTWAELTHPDDLSADVATFTRVLAGEIDRYSMDKRFIRKDGRVIDATIFVNCVRNSDGSVAYLVGLLQDISDRKRAEELLQRQTTQLAALHEIELEIGAQSELSRVLEVVTRRAGESQNASHCAVFIRDPERAELAVAAALDNNLIGVRLREGEGLAGRVVATGGARAIDNYSLWEGRAPVLEGMPRGPGLAAPLKWQHVVIGAIIVFRQPGEDAFTPEDARFLEQIAAVSAIAIHQATLLKEVQEAHKRLQVLAHSLIDAQEAERKRLARELHDRIGQALTAVQINLQSMQSSPDGAYRLEESLSVIEDALKQAHDLSLELRPSLLDDLGLVAALRWYVERVGRRAQLLNCFDVDSLDMRLPPEIETACFRIAQEALTNVVRHAQATTIWVELKSSDSALELIIRDDGEGFSVRDVMSRNGPNASLGLQGMRERAVALGGLVEIASDPGQGSEVRATFPLKDVTTSSQAIDEA